MFSSILESQDDGDCDFKIPNDPIDSSNVFFTKLYPEIFSIESDSESESEVFSPYSLFIALCLLLPGGKNKTEEEIRRVISLISSDQNGQNIIARTYRRIISNVSMIRIANGLFVDGKEKLKVRYVNNVQDKYKAIVKKTTFPEPGMKEINEFVSKVTNGEIRKVLEKLHVDSLVKIVIVNAIYFCADWKNVFEKSETIKKYPDFEVFGEKYEGEVDMMCRQSKELYGEHKMNGIEFKSVTLPYTNGTFEMIFIRLEEKSKKAFADFEKKVLCRKSNFVSLIKKSQKATKLTKLMIPKFTVESSFELVEPLQKIGMKEAFDENKADFSGIMKTPIYISKIIQKAKMMVDEKGTIASAATSIVMRTKSKRQKVEQFNFILDRPFTCFLIHKKSSIVLFSAKIIKPKFVSS